MAASIEQRAAEVRQRLTESLARRATGESDWEIETNLVAAAPIPRVSVIVTVYNYARFLESCLSSVARSSPVPGGVEIIIVDDASTDDSVEVARELVGNLHIASTLVRKRTNTGLADARNVGLQIARGALVLTLDADNWIDPECLPFLAEVLVDETIAASYPILRRVVDGSAEPVGMISAYPWELRRLVRGPYIDALALLRRDVVMAVGGYSTELIEHGWFGWEDYDLWLKLASAGHRVVHVPRVLATYRTHSNSMLHTTNRGVVAIARYLARKFAPLADTYPDLETVFGFVRRTPAGQSETDRARSWQRRDGRSIPTRAAEVRAVVVVRNEANRLPQVLDHHRRLGIDRFFVIDNGSTDGTADYLAVQPDVHVFWTQDSYHQARLGLDWIERVLDEFCDDHWSLLLDADELLVYPGPEATITELCTSLERRGLDCLATMFVDMYSDEAVAATVLRSGQLLLDRCPYFDRSGYYRVPTGGTVPRMFGGVRARLFWPDVDLATLVSQLNRAAAGAPGEVRDSEWPEEPYLESHPDVRRAVSAGDFKSGLHHYALHGKWESRILQPWPPCISQIPLVRWQKGLSLCIGRHEMPSVAWRANDRIGGALLHFRLMADAAARAQAAAGAPTIAESAVWKEENARYARALSETPELTGMSPDSIRYTGVDQLVALDLVQPLD